MIAAFTGLAALAFDLPTMQAMLLAIPGRDQQRRRHLQQRLLPPAQREFIVTRVRCRTSSACCCSSPLLHPLGRYGTGALLALAGGGALSLGLSVLFAVGLVLILMRIDGHVRFIPLLAGLFGLYAWANCCTCRR